MACAGSGHSARQGGDSTGPREPNTHLLTPGSSLSTLNRSLSPSPMYTAATPHANQKTACKISLGYHDDHLPDAGTCQRHTCSRSVTMPKMERGSRSYGRGCLTNSENVRDGTSSSPPLTPGALCRCIIRFIYQVEKIFKYVETCKNRGVSEARAQISSQLRAKRGSGFRVHFSSQTIPLRFS